EGDKPISQRPIRTELISAKRCAAFSRTVRSASSVSDWMSAVAVDERRASGSTRSPATTFRPGPFDRWRMVTSPIRIGDDISRAYPHDFIRRGDEGKEGEAVVGVGDCDIAYPAIFRVPPLG